MASVPVGIFVGAITLGFVHGIEPGHGWPVAATYALDRRRKWLSGLVAGLLIGIGHLVSSIAVVAVFFYAKSYFELSQVNEPIEILDGIHVGGPVSVVAGLLLIALGVREYYHGHDHGHGHHDHEDGHDHGHGDHDHSHGLNPDQAADRGLLGIAWFAFLLGFAHEEEFEIIALCAGSAYCLELMLAYALTVIVGIVGLTLLLIAGYQHYEERVERFTPYLPLLSATVLIVMGLGFVVGLF